MTDAITSEEVQQHAPGPWPVKVAAGDALPPALARLVRRRADAALAPPEPTTEDRIAALEAEVEALRTQVERSR